MDIWKIRKNLEEAGGDARFEACMELYSSDDETCKKELNRIITANDPILAIHLIRFLAKISEEKAVEYLVTALMGHNDIVIQASMKAIVANKLEGKLEIVFKALKAPLRKAVYFAIEQLSKGIYQHAIDPLIFMLKGADDEMTIHILSGLRYLVDKRALIASAKYLKHPNEEIRFKAVLVSSSHCEVGYLKAHRILVDMLKDNSVRIRQAAVWGLRRYPRLRDFGIFMHLSKSDPDVLVRQESILGLIYFKRNKVVNHLLEIIVYDKDRLVKLKAESVLVEMPTRLLVKGLKKIFSKKDEKLKNKALILFAENQKKSKSFFKFLIKGIQKSKTDKDMLPYIQALGVLENEKAIGYLNEYFKKSYLVAYTCMLSLIKIWKTMDSPPVLEYVGKKDLNDILKQMVLKFILKSGKKEIFNERLCDLIMHLLSDNNLNIRYLSAEILVLVRYEKSVFSMFDQVLKETDATTQSYMKTGVGKMFGSQPSLFVDLFLIHLENNRAIRTLFEILESARLPEESTNQLVYFMINEPVNILNSPYERYAVYFFLELIISKRIQITQLFMAIDPKPNKARLLSELVEALRTQDLRLDIPFDYLQKWFYKGSETEKRSIIELCAYSNTPRSVKELVTILSNSFYENFHSQASRSLNVILRSASA